MERKFVSPRKHEDSAYQHSCVIVVCICILIHQGPFAELMGMNILLTRICFQDCVRQGACFKATLVYISSFVTLFGFYNLKGEKLRNCLLPL
jgi:hypothetical protein